MPKDVQAYHIDNSKAEGQRVLLHPDVCGSQIKLFWFFGA